MDTSSERYVLLNQLADEFVARYRRGERPSVQEYCDRHPELADDIREFFPTLVEMERVKEDAYAEIASAPAVPSLRQLGDYQILREIGHGGMGVVYEADQVSLGRRVALKLLTQRMLRDANQRRRFEREAKSAARLHHTNIVPVFGSGEHEGTPYYVMQFIQGTGLDVVVEEVAGFEGDAIPPSPPPGSREVPAAAVARSLVTGGFAASTDEPEGASEVTGTFAPPALANPIAPPTDRPTEAGSAAPRPHSTSTVRIPPDTSGGTSSVTLPGHSGIGAGRKARKFSYWQGVARIGVQVADALEYAHRQGIIHRDVKPSNLLLDLAGTVWVTDFGLAKADGAENLTHTGDILGTLRYMPPEAFDGKADARSDLYSLGLTLYEMLALRPAFGERDRNKLIKQVTSAEPIRLRKVRRGVPRDLETIVHKAINRDPVQRYQRAEELAADLQRFLDDEPIKARRQSATEAAWRWARQHAALAILLVTVGALLVAVAASSIVLAAHFRQQETVQRGLVDDKTELAERNRKLADDNEAARATTERALRQAETTLVDMQVSRGLLAAERGDSALAVLWFAKAAEQAASDPILQADNRLRARNWARDVVLPVNVVTLGRSLTKMDFRPGDELLLLQVGTQFFVWDWRQEKTLPWADGNLPISAACWSPDGMHLAVGLPTGGVQIRSVPDGAVVRTLAHPGPVTALVYSPDGTSLAVGGLTVRLWDTRDSTFLKPSPPAATDSALRASWAHPLPVDAVVFNGKGTRVATACRDKKVRVFSVTDRTRAGALFPPLAHTPLFPSPPAFIDGDRGLVTVTGPRELTWWDAETGTRTRPDAVRLRPTTLEQVAASPRGDWLAVGGNLHGELWDVENGGKKPVLLDHINSVKDFEFSPDGKLLLTASRDHTARLWSLPDARPVGYPLAHMAEVTKCAISGDTKYLATARIDGQICIWKRPANTSITWENHDWATRPRLSFDGRLLAPGHWHESPNTSQGLRSLAVLSSATGKPAGPAPAIRGIPLDSCVCADNRTAATLVRDNVAVWLFLWDVPTGRVLFDPKKLPAASQSVSPCPRGTHATVACQNDDILIFDFRTGELVHSLRNQSAGLSINYSRAEYSPDGATLVTLSADANAIRVWDATTGKLRYPPIRPLLEPGFCRSFAISADGKMLATAVNGKNAVQVWDLTTGRALSEPLPHPGDLFGLFHVAFSPDGRYVLTGCKDGQARLWDWKTGTLACPPLVHRDEVFAVAFSLDGRYAVSAVRGNGGAVQVWELATGKPVSPPIRFPYSVHTLALSSDGSRLFAVSEFTVTSIDLAELISASATRTEDYTLLGELTSAQRIELGDVNGLTGDQWLERWKRFHQKNPAFDRPTLSEAVTRSTIHRQRARKLFEGGHYMEAIAAWRQAIIEIDRAAGSDEQRRPLRAEVLKEARTLHDQLLTAQPENATVAGSLADLLLESRESVEWTVLPPIEMRSTGGAKLTRLSDGSVLAGGFLPAQSTYTIEVQTALRDLTTLRLEVLPHASLPQSGPGRYFNGNFHLSEITLSTTGPPGELRHVPFVRAAATHTRPVDYDTTIRDGPSGAIDGTPSTRWDVWGQIGRANAAFFETAKPFGDGTNLIVQLHFLDAKYKTTAIGRFRLSVTTRPNVVRDENLIALTADADGWTRLGAVHIINNEWNLAVDALQKAVAAPGRAATAHLLLALVREHLGQHAATDKHLDEVIKQPTARAGRTFQALAVELMTTRIAREPKNPLCLIARFRWRAQFGPPAAALADLDEARKLDPGLRLTPEDVPLLSAVGDIAAAQGEWPLVGSAYARVLDLAPQDHWLWYRAACIHAFLGNEKEYRRTCAGLLRKFGATNDQTLAERISKACCLLPGAVEDRVRLGKLAELAGKPNPALMQWAAWHRLAKGLAEYREGRFAVAAE